MAVSRSLVTPPGRRIPEPEWVHLETSAGPDGHTHCASIDAAGAGRTSPGRDGHTHQVDGLDVLPAEDGHAHELGELRCRRKHRHGVS
jgi:hypothetical protein